MHAKGRGKIMPYSRVVAIVEITKSFRGLQIVRLIGGHAVIAGALERCSTISRFPYSPLRFVTEAIGRFLIHFLCLFISVLLSLSVKKSRKITLGPMSIMYIRVLQSCFLLPLKQDLLFCFVFGKMHKRSMVI